MDRAARRRLLLGRARAWLRIARTAAAVVQFPAGMVATHAAHAAGAPRAVLLSASDPGDAAALEAIRAHLTGLPLDVLDAPARGPAPGDDTDSPLPCAMPDGAATLAAVCVQRRRSGELLVYLTEDGGKTTLVRRFFPEPRGSAASLEELGVAVRALVQALLDGGHVGVTHAAPPATRAAVLAMGLGYVGTLLSTDLGWQSGVDVAVLGRVRGPFVAEARYSFFPSVAAGVPGSSAVLTLERHPIDVAAGFAPAGTVAPEVWFGCGSTGSIGRRQRRAAISARPRRRPIGPQAGRSRPVSRYLP